MCLTQTSTVNSDKTGVCGEDMLLLLLLLLLLIIIIIIIIICKEARVKLDKNTSMNMCQNQQKQVKESR